MAAKEFVCLLGPSGCGKTTLLNLVAGFIRPTRGLIFFNGCPVDRPGPDRGVVFQDPTLFPWLTVRQNVEFALLSTSASPAERDRRVREALRIVGLTNGFDSFPHALSGGMRQRAALARVLVLDPEALLMDEPFSALDAGSRETLRDELVRIWSARKRSVLFVTHSVEEAAYLADRVIVMGMPPRSVVTEVPVPLTRPRTRPRSRSGPGGRVSGNTERSSRGR